MNKTGVCPRIFGTPSSNNDLLESLATLADEVTVILGIDDDDFGCFVPHFTCDCEDSSLGLLGLVGSSTDSEQSLARRRFLFLNID